MDIDELKVKRIPEHIAIIMDGNGRWAKSKNLPRPQGHVEGAKRVDEIVKCAHDFGIKVLTLFTFSTENWNRPQIEISLLMATIVATLNNKLEEFMKNNIRFEMLGRREGIPAPVLETIDRVKETTKNNDDMILNIAFNYGARQEIVDAVKTLIYKNQRNEITPQDITPETFSRFLYTKDLPDPDLLIRTSGEQRISNFLLWQLSYAEFFFTDKLWPEFYVEDFLNAIHVYQNRERRFGATQGVTGR